MNDAFCFPFRVRYGEVDLQSVVFNARYLDYADLVITEYWRDIGLHFSGEEALEFHVARAEIDFKKVIRADEWIEGRATTQRIGNSSVNTLIELHGMDASGTNANANDLRASIHLVHVHVDLESGKPMPVPDTARAVLNPINGGVE